MRLLVAGSRRRWWTDPNRIADFVDEIMDGLDPDSTVLVNGLEPSGVDRWAKEAAERMGIAIEPHAADWDKYGRAAGAIRNEEMAKVADEVWLVWDGRSPGTKNMLDMAVKHRRHLTVWFP